jgi:hypothetical protein
MDINEILEEIFDHESGTGSIRAQCHCGRTHFVHQDADWDENEYEELVKKQTEEPDKYIQHYQYDSISCKEFNGSQWVMGCHCNWHHKYASFMWHERSVIIKFLRKCREHKIKEAMDIEKLMHGITDIDA